MDLTKCIKYVDFMHQECKRFLDDGVVTDEELYQLIADFNDFKDRVQKSDDLPLDVKERVARVEFDYNTSRINRNKVSLLATVLTLGLMYVIVWNNQQKNRKIVLTTMEGDLDALKISLKLREED